MPPLRDIYDWRPKLDENNARQLRNFPDLTGDARFEHLYDSAKGYSMLGVPGFFNLYKSVEYVIQAAIPGPMIECGCFLGGASIFMAMTAQELGERRSVVAFDTFAGFPQGSVDVVRESGEQAPGPSYESFVGSVRQNVLVATGDTSSVELVEGDVADTVPSFDVEAISILRLDTDYYDSTRIELENLYPKLSPGGVLIIDDYGYYEGSRRATDEYLQSLPKPPLLQRIDKNVRCAVVT